MSRVGARLFRKAAGCVCVCVSIYRPAAHMLMTCVLETPKEYRTPGGVSPWASKLYIKTLLLGKNLALFVCSQTAVFLQFYSRDPVVS